MLDAVVLQPATTKIFLNSVSRPYAHTPCLTSVLGHRKPASSTANHRRVRRAFSLCLDHHYNPVNETEPIGRDHERLNFIQRRPFLVLSFPSSIVSHSLSCSYDDPVRALPHRGSSSECLKDKGTSLVRLLFLRETDNHFNRPPRSNKGQVACRQHPFFDNTTCQTSPYYSEPNKNLQTPPLHWPASTSISYPSSPIGSSNSTDDPSTRRRNQNASVYVYPTDTPVSNMHCTCHTANTSQSYPSLHSRAIASSILHSGGALAVL